MRFSNFPSGTNPNPGHQKEQDGANNHKKEPLDMDQNNNKGDPLDTKQNNNKGEPLEVAEGLMEALCHIQTKIVRYLDQNDLKNCRLVSRTWCLSMDTWIWANILRYVRAFCYISRLMASEVLYRYVTLLGRVVTQILGYTKYTDKHKISLPFA